jgi:predicted dehydrogenase
VSRVGLALVGCGNMGRGLISSLQFIPEAELVIAVDAMADAAKRVALDHSCDFATDLDAALVRNDVDAVIIATPNFLHAPQAIAAARAGKHVFTEKPLALSAADGAAMIRAAREAGTKLMVGQVLRYVVPFVWVLEGILGGEWGEPFAAQITRLSGGWHGTRYDDAWRMSAAQSGGALFEIHVHEIDFMNQIFGQPESVYALTGRFLLDDVDYYDTAEMLVRYPGGKPVQFFTGNSAFEPRYDAKILCTEADIYLAGFGGVHVHTKGDEVIEPNATDLQSIYEPGTKREMREFIQAITADEPVTISAEDGLAAIEVADAAVRSSETGDVIRLPLVEV